MNTGIDSYTDLTSIGPLFPFPGSEIVLVVLAALGWIGWHVWQLRAENREYAAALARITAEAPATEAADGDGRTAAAGRIPAEADHGAVADAAVADESPAQPATAPASSR